MESLCFHVFVNDLVESYKNFVKSYAESCDTLRRDAFGDALGARQADERLVARPGVLHIPLCGVKLALS
eukprot:2415618-Pleurochrysis_carterae.AAC.1